MTDAEQDSSAAGSKSVRTAARKAIYACGITAKAVRMELNLPFRKKLFAHIASRYRNGLLL